MRTPDVSSDVARVVSVNGRLQPAADARVSIFDRGLLYGDGIFETFRIYDGRPFRFNDHWRRLQRSTRSIGLRLPHTAAWFHRQIDTLLDANLLTDALVRLTITRGAGPAGLEPPTTVAPTIILFARPFAGYPKILYQRGLTVIIASIRRPPPSATPPYAKSLSYLGGILAKREAVQRGANDALLLSVEGHVCEGTTSNLFFVRAGTLYTPSVQTGLLQGITRQVVLELARRLKIPVRQGLFLPKTLLAANELFLTNTSYEVMPVVKVDGRRIGTGKPGPVTRRLHQAFQRAR
ncbi:MAG: aminotransferase class IV [Nitrospirae bacterium]|nr:aminotransferase class IV [Nitrospirota bacterium]